MNHLESALVEIVEHLDAHRIPYMAIGGYATLHWGRPRLTQDIDIKIEIEEGSWPGLIAGLSPRFRVLVEQPLAFMTDTRVLPISTQDGTRIDLVVGELLYERQAIQRAAVIMVGETRVRICTAEDLILHKIISDRPRDLDDVEGVIARSGDRLDREYLDPKIREMSIGLEKSEIMSFYHSCLAKAGLRVP